MILEFYVSNYLSIKDGLKISFVATSLKDSLSESNDMIALSDTGLMLLRSAVIYGANASGKSNVLKAMAFYRHFITDSFKNSQAGEAIDVENFRLNATSIYEPTTMEATFIVGDFIYRYGALPMRISGRTRQRGNRFGSRTDGYDYVPTQRKESGIGHQSDLSPA